VVHLAVALQKLSVMGTEAPLVFVYSCAFDVPLVSFLLFASHHVSAEPLDL
jgi:hypothetical protein